MKKCKFCQTEKDDLNGLLNIKADCGAFGEMLVDAQIYCYDPRPSSTLSLYLWQNKETGYDQIKYIEIGKAEMAINFCPVCGRNLNRIEMHESEVEDADG